ncbi:MAG: L,D-transpeptidase family protein [Planctomycetota bacterium]
MQTIKTAAIVVLMLTVLYGGYVSLTTPPEPLPDEIADFLTIEEFGEEFAIEEDASSEFALTEPPAVIDDPITSEPPETMMPSIEDAASDAVRSDLPANPGMSLPTFGGSFADLPSTDRGPSERNSNEPGSEGNAGLALGSNAPSMGLPPNITNNTPGSRPKTLPPAPSGSVQPNPIESYGSTASRFEMPSPAGSNGLPGSGEGAFASSDTGAREVLSDQGGISSLGGNTNRSLTNAFATADAMYAKGQLKEALATLSVFYGTPNLSETERGQLLARLDPLAREVIYSRRHLLEQPHRVSASETLVQVAERYDIPWQLLSKINGIEDPVTVLPGTELKMVRGPFRAEVNLSAQQMTLFLGDLYAGRFTVAVGTDPSPRPGTFTIQDKQTARVYYDGEGRAIEAGSPDNPYGNMWLDLGGQICIHGSPNTVLPTDQGCISIAGDLAEDVYGILSQGSSVTIRR